MALSPNSRITSSADFSNYFMPYESGTGRMVLRTGASDRVSVLYSGNVGIGTTNPATRLDVAGNTNVTGNLTVVGTGNITASGTISGGNLVANYQDLCRKRTSSIIRRARNMLTNVLGNGMMHHIDFLSGASPTSLELKGDN
jgi:hypothetical protein